MGQSPSSLVPETQIRKYNLLTKLAQKLIFDTRNLIYFNKKRGMILLQSFSQIFQQYKSDSEQISLTQQADGTHCCHCGRFIFFFKTEFLKKEKKEKKKWKSESFRRPSAIDIIANEKINSGVFHLICLVCCLYRGSYMIIIEFH